MNRVSRTINSKVGTGKNAKYLYGCVNQMDLLNSAIRGTIKLYNQKKTEYAEVDVSKLRSLAKKNAIRARFTSNGIGVYCVQDMPKDIYTVVKVPTKKTVKPAAKKGTVKTLAKKSK